MLWWPPDIKLFSLLLHICNFATVINCNINICFLMVLDNACEKVVWPTKGSRPRTWEALHSAQFHAWSSPCELSASAPSAMLAVITDSYSPGTASPNKPFLLQVPLVMGFYHSSRKVTDLLHATHQPFLFTPSHWKIIPPTHYLRWKRSGYIRENVTMFQELKQKTGVN